MPFGFFRGGSEEGPPKTTFSDGLNRFPGHVFFELFDDFCDFLALGLGSPQGGELPRGSDLV